MALIRIDRDPPPRKLRVFGLLWLLAFGYLGYLAYRRSGLQLPSISLGLGGLMPPSYQVSRSGGISPRAGKS